MPFDVAAAQKAGYSEDEILAHLTETRKFDVGGALKSGYSKQDVIAHLSETPEPTTAPAAATKDVGPLAHGAMGIVATAVQAPEVAKTFVKNWWQEVNPVAQIKGLSQAIMHPVDALVGMGEAQDSLRLKAVDAFKKGDIAGGTAAALHYLIPVIGPALQKRSEQAVSGDVTGALGGVAGIATNILGPGEAAAALKGGVRVLPRVVNQNPTEAAAMAFMEGEGVPVSGAAATGNQFVRNIQKSVDSTPLGAVVASRAEKATTDALTATSDRLAQRASPSPVIPEQAGAGTQAALTSKMAALGADADTAYTAFKAAESDPANVHTVQTGTKHVQVPGGPPFYRPTTQTVPVMEDVALPVDVTGIKAALQPLYENMQKWMEPAKRDANAGFQAMKSIIEGKDVLPASQAEIGLGGLKGLARDGSPRNAGVAKFIIPKLQQQIDDAAALGGQSAIDGLQAGRAATAAKYTTEGVLDQLRTEPVQTFNQLTWQKDSGVELLRQVQKEVPSELPKIGRAYLENLFTKATAEGGFSRAQGLQASWQNLGPETKRLLFQDPQLVGDLDKFFLGAKKIAENPNPSGTEVVSISAGSGALMVTQPHVGIPMALGAGALSKLLHSPLGVRLLTEGMKIPVSNKAAAAFTAGSILRLVGDEANPAKAAREKKR